MNLKTENTILVYLYSFDGVLLILNLIFAVYISIWYFFRLRVKGAFIILFYIFVDLTTVARIFEMYCIVRNLMNNKDNVEFYKELENDKRVE